MSRYHPVRRIRGPTDPGFIVLDARPQNLILHGPLRENIELGSVVALDISKRCSRGVAHQPPSTAEFKERVELYLYSPSGCLLPVVG